MLNIKEQQRIYRHERIRNGLGRNSPSVRACACIGL